MDDRTQIQPMFADHLKPKAGAASIERILAKTAVYWPLYLFSLVLALSVAYLYLRYKTPVYMVNAKLLINDQRKGAGDMDLLNDLGIRSRSTNVDNEMEILRSAGLMREVVSSLDLHINYAADGTVTSSELYNDRPLTFVPLFHDTTIQGNFRYSVSVADDDRIAISDGKKTWNTRLGDTVLLPIGSVVLQENSLAEVFINNFDVTVKPVTAVASQYSSKLLVSNPNRIMSIINLSITDVVPQRGADVLDRLMQVYMQSNIDDRNMVAEGTMEFINDRLVLVSSELTDIEKDIEGFKRANELTDIKAQSSLLLSTTGDFTKQLNEQEIQLSLVESLEEYIKDNIDNPRIVPASLVTQDAVLPGIVQNYNELLAQREQLLLTNTENSPYVININNRIANLRADMLSSLASVKRQLKVTIAELQKLSGRIDAQIRQVPAKERVFLEYSRQQTIKQELYLFLLKKREETAITKSATAANAKIVDEATPVNRPVAPKRKVVFLSAIAFGLLLPSIGLFIKDLLNVRVSSKEEVLQATSMTVLAEIGHSDDETSSVVKEDGNSLVSEQFRGLRTNLQFFLSNQNDKVILITSSMSGEGKSFIAINLASILAVSGKKVLLIELDLRKPKVSQNLGLDNSTGFSHYVIGRAELDEIIVPSGIYDNFFVLPSGPVPPNPAELLLLPKTADMFAILKQSFDFIVVDTAPVGLVTDAQLLAPQSSAVLYIIREGYTYRQQLAAADELFRSGKMPQMNLVINDVKSKDGRYGYGYGYGYHGNGYFNQNDEGSRTRRAFKKLKRRFKKNFS